MGSLLKSGLDPNLVDRMKDVCISFALCVFRGKTATHSDPNRSTYSDPNRPGIPIQIGHPINEVSDAG
jgi:hypothetical protein